MAHPVELNENSSEESNLKKPGTIKPLNENSEVSEAILPHYQDMMEENDTPIESTECIEDTTKLNVETKINPILPRCAECIEYCQNCDTEFLSEKEKCKCEQGFENPKKLLVPKHMALKHYFCIICNLQFRKDDFEELVKHFSDLHEDIKLGISETR